MGERMVTADDGVHLWMRDTGDPGAPSVVCCHGGPGLADNLEPVEHLLAPAHRVIRWDQRGSGRSDRSGPYSIDRFVADLECIRTAAELDRPAVLGHSWGANLALFHAQRHPDAIDRLIYVAGTGLEWWPRHSAVHEANQTRRLGPRLGARLEELRHGTRSPEEDEEYRLLSIRSELHDTNDVPLALEVLAGELRFPASHEANAALNAESWRLELVSQVAACERVRVPVLVVHGASDPRPVGAVASLVDALPNATLRVLEGVGHTPWLNDPESFRAVVDGFLRDRG